MKNRLSRIFSPDTGHTVMLAIDHGYFQGPTTGLERVDVTILPLGSVRGRPDVHPRHPALDDPRHTSRRRRDPRERRPEHPEGALEREDRGGPRGRRADERARGRRPGLHRRRVRDPVDRQPDPAGRCRLPRRHPGARRHRRRQGAGRATSATSASRPGSAPSSGPRSSRPTTARRLRARHRRLPGADRHGRRQEAARAGRPDHGLPRHPRRRRRRGHGPQHLPVGVARRHDPGRRQGRPRGHEARGRLRGLPGARPRASRAEQ